MHELASSLPLLLSFGILLLLLAWLSRQISLYIQVLVQQCTGSSDWAAVVLFLVFLPGTFVHEGAHWVTAYLLGLKPSKFRVWPKKRGKYIGLGSVSVRQGGIWLDTLVGLAPLLIGTFFTALITHRIFHAYMVTELWKQGQWQHSIASFHRAWQTPDGALWIYLLFAISNAMLPSASDRKPAQQLLLYVSVAAVIYGISGLPLDPVGSAADWLRTPLQDLNSAFVFVILLDIVILSALFILAQIAPIRKEIS